MPALLRGVEFYGRLFLGILFFLAALGKVTDVKTFAVMVGDYRLLPGFLVLPFSYLLSWTELGVGILLTFRIARRTAAVLCLGLMLVFLAANGVSMARGLDIECGCFDIPLLGSSKVGWHTFTRNLILLAAASAVAFLSFKDSKENA